MKDDNKGIIKLIGKKYTYNILSLLNSGPRRFKAIEDACRGEKMRTQRLKEMEGADLIEVRAERHGRRAVSMYSISEKGKKALKLAEDLKDLDSD